MFDGLIGQDNVKKKLSFYLKAFNKTSICPFLNFVGAKGLGKTEFAKAFARNLTNEDGSKRPFIEINCSTIKNNEAFFEQIFLPVIANNEVTILLDEAHALPKDLTNAFLTIFNNNLFFITLIYKCSTLSLVYNHRRHNVSYSFSNYSLTKFTLRHN